MEFTATKSDPIDLFSCAPSDAQYIEAKVRGVAGAEYRWIFDASGETETHDPMDRIGDPFTVHAVCGDSWGRNLYLFWIEDCYFPRRYFVFGDHFGDAYEWFIEDRAEELDISDCLADYEEPYYTGTGIPVDTESVQGIEVEAIRIVEAD